MAGQIRHQDTLLCVLMGSWSPSLPCVNVALLCAGFQLLIKSAQSLCIHPGHILFLPSLLIHDLHIPDLSHACFLLLACPPSLGCHGTAQAPSAMRGACRLQQPTAWPFPAFWNLSARSMPIKALLGADSSTLSWQGKAILGLERRSYLMYAKELHACCLGMKAKVHVQKLRAWGASAPWLRCRWCQAVSCLSQRAPACPRTPGALCPAAWL